MKHFDSTSPSQRSKNNGPKGLSSTARLLALSLIVFTSASVHAQFGTSPWTAPAGSYTVPAGVTSLTVTCYGGGGGGGGAYTTNYDDADGGGGGGGACSVTTFAVTPGQTIVVAVGAGGTAGNTSGSNGGNGGTSSVTISGTTYASAAGGNGGGGGGVSTAIGAGGTGATTGTGTVHTGGNGAAGNYNSSYDWAGSGGGGGGTTANGGAGSNSGNPPTGGTGGATGGGAGGKGVRVTTTGSGTAGATYGGGGGGGVAYSTGYASAAGKAGGAGAVIITYTVVTCTQPTAYSMTGGGTYCAGGSGVAVGLANSQSGGNFSYQLKVDGTNTGSPVIGTGGAISFGNQTAAGTYTVLCTNTSTSCTNTMTGSVTVATYANNLAITATGTNQTSCNNGSGSIATTPSGGSGSYTYAWSNGASTQNLTSLLSGTYTITLTDATCPSFTAPSASATITAPWTASASAGATGCTTQVTALPSTLSATLFSETFESMTTGNITTSATPWREAFISGFGDTYWRIVNANQCAISGSRSLSLYNAYWGTICDYDDGDYIRDVAYNVNTINATTYTNLKMNFKWSGYCEPGYDYMQVCYSTDGGANWNVFPTQFSGANSVQTVTNFDISAADGQSFLIGFLWTNDAATYGTPIVVDDITITGDKVPTYSWSGPSGATYSASNTIQNPYVDQAGTYSVAVTTGGCTSTASVAVSVGSQSTDPTSISGTPSVCSGGTTTLTTNGGSLGSGATDIWYSGSATEIFDQTWNTQPYSTPNTTVNSYTNGILNVTSTNNDPMIDMSGLGSFNPAVYKNIHIRYRVTSGTGGVVEIFFYNGAHNYAVGGESATGALISDGQWHVLNIDMTQDPDYTANGNILGWRFDWSSNSGVTMDIDFIALGDGVIVGDGTTYQAAPATTTTYYTKKKGACNNTNAVSATVTISTPSTAVTGISGGGTICQGAGVTLTATGGSLGTGANYQWGTGTTVGTNPISGATSSTYSVTPSSTTSYWVSVTGPSPCNGAGGTYTTVTIATPSTAVTGISSGGGTICQGAGVTLTATGGSLGTGANYQWGTGTTVGTNPISGATSSTYSVTPSSTTSYWVSVTGPSPCNGAGGTYTTVTVATPSTAVTGISGGGGTICQGTGVILTASGGSLGTGANYQWGTGTTVGTNPISGATSSTYSVTPSSTTSYWVSVTGPSPCNGAGGTYTTVTVATPSTAVTGISGGGGTICQGMGVTLTASGGSLGTGANYQWGTGTTVGTNPISGATSSTYSVTPSSTTSYWVSVTGPSPCNGAGGVYTTVAVATPSTAVTGISGTTTLCSGTGTTLTATGGSLGTGANYQWGTGTTVGTNPISGATSSTYSVTPSSTTSYWVSVTGPSPCNGAGGVATTVTLISATANAALATNSVNGVTLSEQCTDNNGWTYYADPSAPNNWLFGVYKNGNSFTPSVTLTVNGSPKETRNDALKKASYTLDRYWNVTISGSISSSLPVKVRFFYSPSDTVAMRAAAASRASAYGLPGASINGLEWFKTTAGIAFDPANNTYSDVPNKMLPSVSYGSLNSISYVEYQGLTSFSGGTAGMRLSPNGVALPVQLMYLTATPVDNSYLRLDWATASEINNRGFEVQRSTDGLSYETIGWVDGHGNSNTKIDYSYDDKTVIPNSIYYYRLRQLDFDGKDDYSNIVSGTIIGKNGFVVESLRPNPASNKVTVQVVASAGQSATVTLTDALGRELQTRNWEIFEGFNGIDLDLTAYAAGTYSVTVRSQNSYYTSRLVVNR